MTTHLVVLLVLAVGCGETKEAATDKAPAAGDRNAAAPPAAARPAGNPLAEAEVTALVERWRAAQNSGDFAAYQAVYATRMTGIKRVGARVFRFDRKGWMADRGRMFKKPMEVGVDAIEVAASGSSATVRFEQSFEQGSFRDRGPKQLVVVREAGEPRIAREEMLSSTVLGSAADKSAPPARDFFFILDGEVLLSEAPQAEEGAPVLDPGDGSASHRARAKADMAGLDKPLAELARKTFTVYGEDGAVCETALGRISLVSGVTPHFGTAAEWDGQSDAPKLSDAEKAQVVWDTGTTVLVGNAGICKGLFARAGTPVVAFEPVDDRALAGAVHAAFRKLDEWKQTQATFADSGGTGRWDQGDGRASIRVFRHPTSGKTWAVVHATGGELCSPFSAEMTAVFEQTGASWRNRSAATLEPFEPSAAFDLDGDGAPEFVAPRTLVDDTGGGFEIVRRFAYPDHDCPC